MKAAKVIFPERNLSLKKRALCAKANSTINTVWQRLREHLRGIKRGREGEEKFFPANETRRRKEREKKKEWKIAV